jgi:hypothetical protein
MLFVDNDKSTTFISEEKFTGMYFLLNYRLIKNSSCKHRHHRHLGPGFFSSIMVMAGISQAMSEYSYSENDNTALDLSSIVCMNKMYLDVNGDNLYGYLYQELHADI